MTPMQCAAQHEMSHHLAAIAAMLAPMDADPERRDDARLLREHMAGVQRAADAMVGSLVTQDAAEAALQHWRRVRGRVLRLDDRVTR